MKQVPLLSTMAGLLLCGCSTLHFVTNEPVEQSTEHTLTQHNIAFSLMEVSPPVDLQQRCQGKAWQNVKVERTLVAGLAGAIDDLLIGANVWEPWTVSYICAP